MACVLPGLAWAGGIYKWTDKDGTVHYTNVKPANQKARLLKGSFTPAPPKTAEALSAPARAVQGPVEYAPLIDDAAKRYRIPPSLVRAVMHAESNYNRGAVSPKGALGLMQLMPATAQEMYVKDIFEPKDNIEGGTRYLRVLANEFDGDMVKMVAAYNAGPQAVRKYRGEVPPYQETQAYVRKVLALYFQYKAKTELAQQEAP